MQQPILYMMFGYPGAGKTTASRAIHAVTGAVHVSSDATRAELFPNSTFTQQEHDELYRLLNDRTLELLRQGKSVIYDANLNRHMHRQEKYDICREVDAKPVLVWVQTPKDLARERAAHDSRQHLWPKDETPHQMFDRIASVVEPPTADEPYMSLDGTKITSEYVREQLEAYARRQS